jgi:hypothetical protein
VVRRRRRGGGAVVVTAILPNFVAVLSEGGQGRVVPRVNHVPDVSGHLEEDEDLLDIVQRVWSQGCELVH